MIEVTKVRPLASKDRGRTCCAATAQRIAALAAVSVGVAIAVVAEPMVAVAEPGCPEFRNPATGACEPYVVTSGTEYRGEDAFLAESATLFALSTSDEILELGYSICRSVGRGTPVREIAQSMISGGIDPTSAVKVLANAQGLLC